MMYIVSFLLLVISLNGTRASETVSAEPLGKSEIAKVCCNNIGISSSDEKLNQCVQKMENYLSKIDGEALNLISECFNSENDIDETVKQFEVKKWDKEAMLVLLRAVKSVADDAQRSKMFKKVMTFADGDWWNSFLKEGDLGVFKQSKLLKYITEHYRYKYSLRVFNDWLVTKADYNNKIICNEFTALSVLKFEAERKTMFEKDSDFHLILDALCSNDNYNWDEFLYNEDMRNAEPQTIAWFLRQGQPLLEDVKRRPYLVWGVSPVCAEIATCKTERCVRMTAEAITTCDRVGIGPKHLADYKHHLSYNQLDVDLGLNFLVHFIKDTKTDKVECDNDFPIYVTLLYVIHDSKKPGAELTHTPDKPAVAPVIVQLVEYMNSKKFKTKDANGLITKMLYTNTATAEYGLMLETLKEFDLNDHNEILDLLASPTPKPFHVWENIKSTALDLKEFLKLYRTAGMEDVVKGFFASKLARKCDQKTLESIGKYKKAVSEEFVLSEENLDDLFYMTCGLNENLARETIEKAANSKSTFDELGLSLYFGMLDMTKGTDNAAIWKKMNEAKIDVRSLLDIVASGIAGIKDVVRNFITRDTLKNYNKNVLQAIGKYNAEQKLSDEDCKKVFSAVDAINESLATDTIEKARADKTSPNELIAALQKHPAGK